MLAAAFRARTNAHLFCGSFSKGNSASSVVCSVLLPAKNGGSDRTGGNTRLVAGTIPDGLGARFNGSTARTVVAAFGHGQKVEEAYLTGEPVWMIARCRVKVSPCEEVDVPASE
jgi:hypothetical protein